MILGLHNRTPPRIPGSVLLRERREDHQPTKIMTPLQFAKEQCCNYGKDGTCTGVGIDDEGQPTRFSDGKTKCVLDTTARCGFFEECVIRMNVHVNDSRNATQRVRLEKLLKDRNEAKRLYCKATSAVI